MMIKKKHHWEFEELFSTLLNDDHLKHVINECAANFGIDFLEKLNEQNNRFKSDLIQKIVKVNNEHALAQKSELQNVTELLLKSTVDNVVNMNQESLRNSMSRCFDNMYEDSFSRFSCEALNSTEKTLKTQHDSTKQQYQQILSQLRSQAKVMTEEFGRLTTLHKSDMDSIRSHSVNILSSINNLKKSVDKLMVVANEANTISVDLRGSYTLLSNQVQFLYDNLRVQKGSSSVSNGEDQVSTFHETIERLLQPIRETMQSVLDKQDLLLAAAAKVTEAGELSASDDAEIEIALAEVDIKDKYKDATLLPKWRAFHTIVFLEKDEGLQDSSKIAAFDFDQCLANTIVKITGADQWPLMFPSIPDKLQKLYNEGFKLVIFTNESNIDRWTKKRQKAVDSKLGWLNNFIKLVNVPIQVFIACGFDNKGKDDAYRKPKPGMWRVMEKYFNSGIAIDMDQSFYVGDAAGRINDHSDADIKFAEAIGLKFYLPEEYFETKE